VPDGDRVWRHGEFEAWLDEEGNADRPAGRSILLSSCVMDPLPAQDPIGVEPRPLSR